MTQRHAIAKLVEMNTVKKKPSVDQYKAFYLMDEHKQLQTVRIALFFNLSMQLGQLKNHLFFVQCILMPLKLCCIGKKIDNL